MLRRSVRYMKALWSMGKDAPLQFVQASGACVGRVATANHQVMRFSVQMSVYP